MLWGWLAGGLFYAYVVVTVERVDYYLYPLLPLGALVGANLVARGIERFTHRAPPNARTVAIGSAAALVWLVTLYVDRREIAPYYAWSKNVYTRSLALDRTLARRAR